MVREKYVKMHERFIEELQLYSKAIRILSKGYLPISLLPPSKLEKILKEVKIAIAKSYRDYDLDLTRMYLYYDMKLVTFGIDNHRNLIYNSLCLYSPTPRKDCLCINLRQSLSQFWMRTNKCSHTLNSK